MQLTRVPAQIVQVPYAYLDSYVSLVFYIVYLVYHAYLVICV